MNPSNSWLRLIIKETIDEMRKHDPDLVDALLDYDNLIEKNGRMNKRALMRSLNQTLKELEDRLEILKDIARVTGQPPGTAVD